MGLHMFAGKQTHSGRFVDEKTAMQAATVYACIRFIADIMGMVPRKLHQKTGTNRREAVNHPLYDLLKNRPNPYMSAFSFWQTMLANFAIYGRAYARKVTKGDQLIALWPIASACIKDDFSQTFPRFECTEPNGKTVIYTYDEIFHLRGFSLDGFTSISPVDACRQAIGLALTTEEFVARFFGNGAWPGLILQHKTSLSDKQVAQIRQAFESSHGGASNAFRVAVTGGDLQVHKVDVDAQKAQLSELRNSQIEEIARIWRIPPHVIQHLLRSTNNNIEHQGIEVVKYTVDPYAVCVEEAVNNQLLTTRERADGYYCKHNLDALERGDFASRTQGLVTLVNHGLMTINEARALMELDPVEGGDINRTQMQNVPITQPPQPRGVTQ